MIFKKSKLKAGSNSTNIQVGGDAQFGLSYDEARQIALDIFKSNFYEFSEKAAKIALERAEEITEKFLKTFFNGSDWDKAKLEEPAVQSSIYEVQKAYARTGDKELEQRLLDALLARIGSEERHINQIVLDEAIAVLPKLTDNEVKLLSLVVSATKVQYQGVNTLKAFDDFVNSGLMRFFPDKISPAESTHLQYCGCYTLPMGGAHFFMSLGEYLGARYKGLLTRGFSEKYFMEETNGMTLISLGDFIIKNLRNPEVYQFNVLHDNEFDQRLTQLGLGEKGKLLKALWNKTAMNKTEVEKLLIDMNPRASKLIYTWNKTILPAMQLTPVGYAIAIINFNRVMNAKLDFWAFI
ncbi:LPO_1073/Vpar_1526 family protein [Mucilaginibacter boryungensis]|uniref:Uncharacterized protein n=1 Tax=Mucilaginibacter boryungensis TaxID=768480 RepID=A0ABR9XLE9_9SPHI|nr:LPO_1073/Vpar_1526 family protein [Mucilaginibacter boryungensis]MBE9668211.1 hypothetical protein [Mucilaginibacter boryungensis]